MKSPGVFVAIVGPSGAGKDSLIRGLGERLTGRDCVVIARRVVRSPFGLSLQAIKGNALRSSAVGIAVNWRLVAIYTLAAGYAGLAGAVLAQTQQFASLEMFSIDRSADVLLILIIGGTGYLYGGLIGALIYRFAQDILSDLSARYWQYWIGFVLIMMVLFGRIYGSLLAGLIQAPTAYDPLSHPLQARDRQIPTQDLLSACGSTTSPAGNW